MSESADLRDTPQATDTQTETITHTALPDMSRQTSKTHLKPLTHRLKQQYTQHRRMSESADLRDTPQATDTQTETTIHTAPSDV